MTESFEHVNHLVLNFYTDGYSIAVKLNEFPVFTSETILETAKISYDETSLLDYIENEELPPLLVEMIDSSPKLSQYKLWHNGCLILEVRDKINIEQQETNRRINNSKINFIAPNSTKDYLSTQQNYSPPHSNTIGLDKSNSKECVGDCIENQEIDTSTRSNGKSTTSSNSYFILLKPTNLSMLNDVLNLTESNLWSAQDKLQLESQIVLLNSPPLFLEPDANQQPIEQKEFLVNEKINNIYTRHKKKLPHTKLKTIYQSRSEQGYTNQKSLYVSNSSNNISDRNMYQTIPDSLPPELVLQQFLVDKRAKKKPFPVGQLARFHRYKRYSSSHFK